jgi:glycerol-3-phosphate dehydrogenase
MMEHRLQELCENGVDVLILGAGINGAGLFRDLAEQGLRVLMVEKNDYGSGTSAAPSRLIHGGLKYLETGEFRLVAQSTLERNLLLRNAPHVVTALATVIPIFSWTKGVWAALRTLFGSTTAARSRGALLLKVGLSIYDYYGSRANVMPRHQMRSRRKTLAEFPQMTPKIVASGLYYDAKISGPERLVWELLADGMAANRAALALNYCSVIGYHGGTVQLTHEDGSVFYVTPKIVINAGGPWIDRVNALFGETTKMIGGTKGSHILLDHPELLAMLNGQMIYFEADDGRILLVYDYLGKALVGSTDIKAVEPEDVRCDEVEIDYFLASLRAVLPGLAFSETQIVYAYAGIRPLPASDAATPGLISRDHSMPIIEASAARDFPIISLVGGKWTTFRGFAEEAADLCLARLGAARKVSTRDLAIGGGKGYPIDEASKSALIAEMAARVGSARAAELLTRYGTTAQDFLTEPGFDDGPRLPDATAYSLAEIDWLARTNGVAHLGDLVLRRTTLAVTKAISLADLKAITVVMGAVKGWDSATQAAEVAAVVERLARINRQII